MATLRLSSYEGVFVTWPHYTLVNPLILTIHLTTVPGGASALAECHEEEDILHTSRLHNTHTWINTLHCEKYISGIYYSIIFLPSDSENP